MTLTLLGLVCALGAIGSSLRFLVSMTHARYGEDEREWPIGTLAVNTAASLALGILVAGAGTDPSNVHLGLTVGGLGALSTWSTVALEVAVRVDSGHAWRAFGYLAASVLGGIGAAYLGLQLG